MLAGDHPSLGNFPTADTVSLDGGGIGSAAGLIEALGSGITEQNDLFRFTPTVQDFVALYAEAQAAGSLLNSRLAVYEDNGSGVAIQARDAFNNLIAPQSGNGTLSAGNPKDGWIGFVAAANKTYYVLVGTDVSAGQGSTGAYTLRIAARTTDLTLDGATGEATATGTLDRVGQDVIYKAVTGADELFDTLSTFNAQADRGASPTLDVHIEIYDGNGVLMGSDTDAGVLNDSFELFKSLPDSTYYLRVRSDEFLASRAAFATGTFNIAADMIVNELPDPIDPVTRRLTIGDVMADGFHTRTYQFTAQGTGLTIIAMTPGGPPPPPIQDGAIGIYDANGVRVAFNDDRFGDIPQVEILLTGGQLYTIVLDAFSEAPVPGVSFNLFIETHHTFDQTQTPDPADDHPNTPVFDPDEPGDLGVLRNRFRQATALNWGTPYLLRDQYGYWMQDTGWRTDAHGTGRIHGATDNDFFSFVPQVDMLGQGMEGDNGDDGPSLYVGGAFVNAGATTNDIPYAANHIATYDANDWWTVGRGFNGTVRSLVQFDDDQDGTPSLFAAGDFTEFRNDEDPAIDPIPAAHIAKLVFNDQLARWEWEAVGDGVAFNVYAMNVFTPLDNAGPAQLIIGGQNGLVSFDGAAFTALAASNTINGIIHALATFTFDAPDPDGDGEVEDPEPIAKLGIGGTFTTFANWDGLNAQGNPDPADQANRFLFWDPDNGFERLGTGATNGANGAVYALLPYEGAPIVDGPDFAPGLLIGGNFTTLSGLNMSRLSFYTWDEIEDADDANGELYGLVGFGTINGAVRTLAEWDPPDPDGAGGYPNLASQIVIGGEFTNRGSRVARFDWEGGAWSAIGDPNADFRGFNNRVNALTVMADADDIGDPTGDDTLYAGGSFTLADVNGLSGVDLSSADPYTANRSAKLVFDTNPLVYDWVWKSNGNGRENGVDSEVFALLGFNDPNPVIWDHHQRPATKLNIVVSPAFGPNANLRITIYDSNFQIIYTNANLDATIWSSQMPDGSTFPFDTGRAGMIDPSIALPNPQLSTEISGLQVWGGRTYYIAIASDQGSTGRYNLVVTSEPWVEDGPNYAAGDVIDESDPASGQIISIPVGTGDNTNYQPLPNAGHDVRSFFFQGATFISDYGQIETIDDTDCYQFRAQASGYAAVRINTTNILDEYQQYGPRATLTETFSTDLDSYVRILDGDFTQIGFNDDNPFTSGEPGIAQATGGIGNRVYAKRDGYIVFPIVEGDFYYIIVGSGQKWVDASPQDPDERTATDEKEVNWKYAIGGYEITFNTMSDLDAGTDDHGANPGFETPVPIGIDQTDPPTNGKATVTGIINNTLDADAFVFNSPARGIGRVTLDRPLNSTLVARVIVFDGTLTQIANSVTSTTGPLNLQFNAQAGGQYFVYVISEANTTGSYTLNFNMPPYADDHADEMDYTNATTLDLVDYLGAGEDAGSIENPGDVDVFRFEVNDFNTMTVRITNMSPNSFDPRVEIYELSTAWDDPTSGSMWMRIGANDDADGNTTDAAVSFSVTPDRTSLINTQTYRWYYVVVMGEDRAQAAGNYEIRVTFPPTDDYPDAGQYTEAAVILPDPDTGLATQDASIELSGDTDLFYFTALAGGNATVVVDRIPGSDIIPRVTVIQLTPGETTIAQGTAIDSEFGFQAANTGEFHVDRGVIYYIMIEATTDELGAYHVTITSPPLDDYPNQDEWPIAQDIPINPQTGDGAIGVGVPGDPGNAHLSPDGDTDLFRFTLVRTGATAITITSYRGQFGNFAPILTIYDTNLVEIGTAQATSAAGINDPRTVEVSFPSLTSGQTYYILINSVDGLPPPATRTGEYFLTVNGEALDDGGGGDPGAIDFGDPAMIALSSRTGDGSANDFIDEPGDRDLFAFVAPATGKIFVQVVTPNGSILDAAVTILSAPNELPASEVFTDNAGIPGATAAGSFDGVGGHTYYAIVSGISAGIGAYRLIVDAEPQTFYLYYPEGYASLLIREFVSVSNANNYDVHFTVKLRYEDTIAGQPDETVVVSNLTVEAGARGGVTISNAEAGPAAGVQLYRPYAIIIESDGPIGATFSHYDFSSTLGDAFTGTLSASWNFARVERNPGAVFDFLVYYNPNNFDVNVLVTFYTSGSAVTIPQTIQANKRLGLSVNDIAALPTGIVGASVVAAPANPANEASFLGIVASISHYDVANTAGFGYLGDAQGGTTKGVIPSLTHGTGITGELFIFNPGTTRATVTLTGNYIAANLPPLVRTFDVPGGNLLKFDGASLGITANQPMGISYTSNVPVVLASDQIQNGDADATSPFSVGAQRFFFGDAFINTVLAGSLYFETLSFYNPSSTSTSITVTLLFTNSDQINVSVPIGPRGYAQLKLHELPELIQDRPGLNFFSVIASASVPFAATMNHYDLFLQGGWTTSGVPLGITNAFSTIP